MKGLETEDLASARERGTIAVMTTRQLQTLSDEELGAQALEWRRRALQGEWHARGIAHEFESEMRRRTGAPTSNYDSLDLRPLELRAAAQRRWWRFWQAS
ncbi:hypothetical protein J2789_007068 [Variovorax paradoxus]|uniref:hypothetical protein n=1 Tax=Variovorax atrisoli TaxID=3394203 RepID=UPI0011A00E49|nr:hypothetical protein [Variovorax paradoxus]MDR6524357.1 hypothetical protein [Variovorax paradoxus]